MDAAVLAELIADATAAGHLGWAEETACSLPRHSAENQLFNVAMAAVATGEFHRAETIAESLTNMGLMAEASRRLAAASAAAGDFGLAVSTAESFLSKHSDIRPLLEVIKIAVTAGDAAQALAIASALPQERQARAHTLIAEIADLGTSRKLLRTLLRTESYEYTLKAMARADPHSLIVATQKVGVDPSDTTGHSPG